MMVSGADHNRALAMRAGLCILAADRERERATSPHPPARRPGVVMVLRRVNSRRSFHQGWHLLARGDFAMTRRARDLTFRKNDAIRAIKAAQAAGVPNPRIEIDRHGTISIIAGDPPKKNDTATDNPWDKVLINAANQERPA